MLHLAVVEWGDRFVGGLRGVPEAEMRRRIDENVVKLRAARLGDGAHPQITGGEVEHLFITKEGAGLAFQFIIDGVLAVPAARGGSRKTVALQRFLGRSDHSG